MHYLALVALGQVPLVDPRLPDVVPLQKVASLQKYLMCACVSRLVLGIMGWIGGVGLEVVKAWEERDPEDMQATLSGTS